jgi:hypothetical protein
MNRSVEYAELWWNEISYNRSVGNSSLAGRWDFPKIPNRSRLGFLIERWFCNGHPRPPRGGGGPPTYSYKGRWGGGGDLGPPVKSDKSPGEHHYKGGGGTHPPVSCSAGQGGRGTNDHFGNLDLLGQGCQLQNQRSITSTSDYPKPPYFLSRLTLFSEACVREERTVFIASGNK